MILLYILLIFWRPSFDRPGKRWKWEELIDRLDGQRMPPAQRRGQDIGT